MEGCVQIILIVLIGRLMDIDVIYSKQELNVNWGKTQPYQSNCTTKWTETNLNLSNMIDSKPDYTMAVSMSRSSRHDHVTVIGIHLQTCKRNCIQEEIINACHCYHTKMDLALLDEEKIPKEKRRPCSMNKNGSQIYFLFRRKEQASFSTC